MRVDQTLSATGLYGPLAAGSGTYSRYTSTLIDYEDGSWRRVQVVPYGYDPATMLSQSDGAQTTTGNEYESTGANEGTILILPDMEGWDLTMARITADVDMDAGGTAATAATATIEGGGKTLTLVTGKSGKPQSRAYPGNTDIFHELQAKWTLTRTTASTRFTPRLRWVKYEGYGLRPALPAPNMAILAGRQRCA